MEVKVLQINTVCGTGSTGRIASAIHTMLIEQGHESIVAYGRGTTLNCDNTIKIGNNLDFYTHALKTRILDKHGFGSKKGAKFEYNGKYYGAYDTVQRKWRHLNLFQYETIRTCEGS